MMMECMSNPSEAIDEMNVQSNLSIIEKYHDQAFKFINEGLNLDELGKTCDAVTCYTKGLRSIEAGINIPNRGSLLSDSEKKKYDNIEKKLTRTKEQVVYRMMTLNKQIPTSMATSTSIPTEGSPHTTPESSSDDVKEQGKEKNTCIFQESLPFIHHNNWEDVTSLLSIEEGVRLFHVDEKGDVSTWSQPCKLNVFQMMKNQKEGTSPPAFLKCGDWVYPLDPGKSPALKSFHRTYMFPDIRVQTPNLDSDQIPCIGIVLANLVPESVISRFERVLKCYSDFRYYTSDLSITEKSKEKPQRPPPPSFRNKSATDLSASRNTEIIHDNKEVAKPELALAVPDFNQANSIEKHWSDKISDGIQVGAQWVSWGLIKGATYTSTLVEKGAEKLRENVQPSHEPVAVDNQVSQNIRHLNEATGAVAQVSGYMVQALGTMTVNLGKYLAPHLKHHGKKLLPSKYQIESQEHQKKADDMMKVAIAGFQGFGLLFLSLEQAGKDIYNSISNAAVQTVNHRYGEEAADVTGDALGAAGNAAKAYWNVNKLGTKAIAKRAIKDTGKMALFTEEDAIAERSRQRNIQET